MLRKRTPLTATKRRGNYSHVEDCGCGRCFNKAVKATNPKYTARYRKAQKQKNKTANPYFEYIQSPKWQARKERYYQTHKRQCQACGSNRDIDLHHMIYGSFGNEPDTTLVCLCRVCHKDFHSKNKMSKYMMDSTLQYIRNKQATLRTLKKYIELL